MPGIAEALEPTEVEPDELEAAAGGGDPEALEPVTDEAAEIEARARAMGWHPLEEYRGPPERWTDAATFIRRGEDNLPILRDQNRRMSEKLAKMDRTVTDLTRTAQEQIEAIRQLRDLAQRSNEAGYRRALTELKQQQRAAVEAGDTDAFDQISEQISAVETERAEVTAATPKSPPPPPAPAPAPVLDPEVQAFAAENASWWNVDRELSQAMVALHTVVLQRHPNMPLRQQLAEAKRRLVAEFPDRFDEEDMPPAPPAPRPRAAAAAVVAPRSGAAPRQAKTGFDLIDDPAEREQARQAFAAIKRQMPDYTVEEYMAVYQNPRADVIEMRRAKRSGK